MFQVMGRDFPVTYACLELFYDSGENAVCWGVKVVAGGLAEQDSVSRWKPAIVAEVLHRTKPGQVAHWYDIAGTTVAWEEPSEDPQALFEVYETSAIYTCKVQFLTGLNSRVRMVLDGMTDIDASHVRVPIHIDIPLKVAPWSMARRSEQECRDLFDRLGFRDPVKFELAPHNVSTLVFLDQ
jgi:hypothetical protein